MKALILTQCFALQMFQTALGKFAGEYSCMAMYLAETGAHCSKHANLGKHSEVETCFSFQQISALIVTDCISRSQFTYIFY